MGIRASVDAVSVCGRSYKCVEKSDLKYPLIHGQGRQVSEWPPFQNPSSVAPCRGRSSFAWWLWLVSWELLQGPGCLRATVHLYALLVHLLGLFAVTSHLPCPQARLLGTLAVSRGLGDHQLRVLDTNIQLKPFLLSVPQVRGQQPTPASICPEKQTVRLVGAGKGTLRDPQT